MKKLFVFEVMAKNITTCPPETLLKDVVKILSRERLSSLVITVDEEPIGIITERDLVSILADLLNDVVWDELTVKNFTLVYLVTCLDTGDHFGLYISGIHCAGYSHHY